MSKVEKADAPISFILTLEYTTLKIEFEARSPDSQVQTLMLAGQILHDLFDLKHSFPKMTFCKKILCPQCKQESRLEVVDALAVSECPKCGASLKEAIEI